MKILNGRTLLINEIFLLAFLITSCASVPSIPNPIGTKNTFLTVETPGCSRAVCKIENKEGDIYFLNTPDTINISKSRSDFQVTCFIEEVMKLILFYLLLLHYQKIQHT